MARVVVPGLPHHVTQRGVRRTPTFFADEDYAAYTELLAANAREFGLAVWAWCLMPNHVHLVVVPEREESLAQGIGCVSPEFPKKLQPAEGPPKNSAVGGYPDVKIAGTEDKVLAPTVGFRGHKPILRQRSRLPPACGCGESSHEVPVGEAIQGKPTKSVYVPGSPRKPPGSPKYVVDNIRKWIDAGHVQQVLNPPAGGDGGSGGADE